MMKITSSGPRITELKDDLIDLRGRFYFIRLKSGVSQRTLWNGSESPLPLSQDELCGIVLRVSVFYE